MLFKGSHDHSMDNKGRVSIPASFRTELQRLGGDMVPTLTRGKDHLVLYPNDVWEVIAEELAEKAQFDPDMQALERFVVGGSADCPIDAQGRITIPAALRAHADLHGKVTLLGLSKKIEIWNHERIQVAQQTTLGRLDTIQASAAQSTSGP